MAKEKTKAEMKHELDLMDLTLNDYKTQIASLEQRLADAQAIHMTIMDELGSFWSEFSNVLMDVETGLMKIVKAVDSNDPPLARVYLETVTSMVEASQEYFNLNEPSEIVNRMGDDIKPENIFF